MNGTHHAILYRTNTVRFLVLTEIAGVEIVDSYIAKFGVDDARELIKSAYTRPTEAKQQLLVVRTDFITHEAQNALLKVLEEPPLSTRFAFVLPHDFYVLPTLLSRFSVCSQSEVDSSKQKTSEVWRSFLNSSYKERLEQIEKSVKNKDVEWQQTIKQDLIKYQQDLEFKLEILSELEFVSRTLLTRGASNKMLLEHVALILPTRS